MSADKAINSGDTIVSLPRTAALLVTPKMKNPFPDKIDTAYWSKCQWSVDSLSCFLYKHMVSSLLFVFPLLPKVYTAAFLSGNGRCTQQAIYSSIACRCMLFMLFQGLQRLLQV